MTSKNLARRLERLESRLLTATQDPVSFVIVAITSDRQIAGRFRLIPGGLQRLSPDEELPTPKIHDTGSPIGAL
jgi:hypothetical protein